MKLYIPALRDKLLLTKDWCFKQERQHLAYSLTDYLYGDPNPWLGQENFNKHEYSTIPAGVILSVDRIYIRNGAKDYDSITFRIAKTKDKPGARFWVPLSEANNIEFDPVV